MKDKVLFFVSLSTELSAMQEKMIEEAKSGHNVTVIGINETAYQKLASMLIPSVTLGRLGHTPVDDQMKFFDKQSGMVGSIPIKEMYVDRFRFYPRKDMSPRS